MPAEITHGSVDRAAIVALDSPLTLFEPEFAWRALLATLCVALLGGLLGTTIVLRDLPFFTHAVGAGAFPVLVLAAALAVSPALAALLGALLFAGWLWLSTRSLGDADGRERDTRIGLLVARALAAGAVIAAVVTPRGGGAAAPEALLFGSVLTVDAESLLVAVLVTATCSAAVFLLGERWLAAGFDRGAAAALGAGRYDAALLVTVAIAVAATLPVTGSLMAGSLLVAPAATARLLGTRSAGRAGPLTLIALTIAVAEGIGGLYLSLAFDTPAGATIAAVAGGGFVLIAGVAWLVRAARSPRFPASGATAAVAATLLVATLALAGCGSGSGDTKVDKNAGPVVVATTTQTADLVRQVGGRMVVLTGLLQPGTDPHEFEPSPSDVAALAEARVIFRSGGDIDGWLAPALEAAGSDRTPVELADAAVLLSGSGHADAGERDGGAFNSHWYLDPANLQSAAARVRDELIKANPSSRESYRANADGYIARVGRLDRALKRCAASLPRDRRTVLAGHNDFEYLTRRYGLTTAATLSEGGGSEPSARDVQQAVDAGRRRGARAMLVSKGDASKTAAAVSKRLKIPLLELYGDALAQAGHPAATAHGAIAYNLDAIVGAVSGGETECPAPRN